MSKDIPITGVLHEDGSYSGPRIAYALCANHDKLDKPLMFDFVQLIMHGPLEWVLIHQGKHIKSASLNRLVDHAYDNHCTHILFLDADMEFPKDIAPRLLAHKLPIVGGLYHMKSYPFTPIAGWTTQLPDGGVGRVNGRGGPWKSDYYPLPPNQLVEVGWTGVGCLLVDMDVFNQIPFPCFRDDWDDEKGERERGHDMYFCDVVREHGYQVWLDTSVNCGHRMTMVVDKLWVDAFHASNLKDVTTRILRAQADERTSHRVLQKQFQEVENTQLRLGMTPDNTYEVNSQAYWDERWDLYSRNKVIINRDSIYNAIEDKISDGERLADLGSGISTLLLRLRDEKHCAITAYDISESCVKLLSTSGIEGRQVDLTTYSPNGESYPTVLCSHLLEHIDAKHLDRFLTTVRQITERQAFVVVPQDRKRHKEHKRIYTANKLLHTLKPYFSSVKVERINPPDTDKELFVNRHLIAHCEV